MEQMMSDDMGTRAIKDLIADARPLLGFDQDIPETQTLFGYRLENIGQICPEQYDVFLGEVQIAYLRLRHGTFRVYKGSVSGPVILIAHPEGDGDFMPEERMAFLTQALQSLSRARAVASEPVSGEAQIWLDDAANTATIAQIDALRTDADRTFNRKPPLG